MRRLFPALLLLAFLFPVQGASTTAPPYRVRAERVPAYSEDLVGLDSNADLDGTVGFEWALSHGDIHVFCAWQGRATSAGRTGPRYPALAISCPWLVCGPMSQEGLLREASNPLGFSAGSDVFAECTGVRLDGSLPAGPPGFLWMPLPGALGFYSLPCSNGARVCGCFAGIQASAGFRVEGFFSFSKSESEGPGEEWFLSTPVDPGGAIASGGVRLAMDFHGMSLGATAGGSFPESAPSGSFQLLRGSLHEDGFFVEALVGRIDASYRRPDGRDFAAGSGFSGRAGLEGPVSSAKVSYSACVDQPGFAPRPFIQSSEVTGLVLQHSFAAGAGLDLVCRAEAERRISRDCMGTRQETRRWSASLRGTAGSLDTSVSMELNEPGGVGVSLTGTFQETRRSPRLSLESRLEPLAAGGRALTALAGLQLEWKDARLSLESGIEGWAVSRAGVDLVRHVRLSVSWSTRCTMGK